MNDEDLCGNKLCVNLKYDNPVPSTQLNITNLMKIYWCVFVKDKVKIPVCDYKCGIDTGSVHPIVAKNFSYGERKYVIMQQSIDDLESNDKIKQTSSDGW